MTVLAVLHARRLAARATLAEIDARISALTAHPSKQLFDWQRGIAAERIALFLRRHRLLTWSPAELILATQCTETAVRRALTRLVAEERVLRQLHARYRHADPASCAKQPIPLNKQLNETPPGARPLVERSVDELDLSVLAANCLFRAEIKTIGDLTRLTTEDLLQIKWVNKKVVKHIVAELAAIGLALTSSSTALRPSHKTASKTNPRAEAIRHWWTLSDEDLAALPEVSRHNEPQVSPQEYDCGCITVTRVTDRDARRGERPFEMCLIAPCGDPSCRAKAPQKDSR